MDNEPYITIWCSLYCEGQEAVGEMEIEYTHGEFVSLPLCEYCANMLQENPHFALDLVPVDVL